MKKNLIYSLTAIGLVMGSEAVGEVAKIPQGFVRVQKVKTLMLACYVRVRALRLNTKLLLVI